MASDRYREKLLELIGKIGKDDRQGKTASKVSAVKFTSYFIVLRLFVCLSIYLAAMEGQENDLTLSHMMSSLVTEH